MSKGGTPRITDFGIGGAAVEATKTDPGSGLAVRVPTILQMAGSSRYAPAEQVLGAPPHPRDDVYALGVIAYQLILADINADPSSNAARTLRALRIPAELVTLIVSSIALDPERRPHDATEWEAVLAALMKKKTAKAPATTSTSDDFDDDPKEVFDAISESEIANATVSQTLTVAARGRWYSRPAGQPKANWELVASTPAEVRVSPGEVYRFSIKTTATDKDVEAVAALAGLASLRYLNLSYCDGVTDEWLACLKDFPGLRQLFLRGCSKITDAGLLHLHALTELQTVELTDCPQLTAVGIGALQIALPKCKLLR
jgi:serine/threonine protein kinase